MVLRDGDGPEECDQLGARDAWVFEADGTYYMHYDAAGPEGWLLSSRSAWTSSPGRRKVLCWTSANRVKTTRRPPRMALPISTAHGGTCSISVRRTCRRAESGPVFPLSHDEGHWLPPAGPWIKQPEVVPVPLHARHLL